MRNSSRRPAATSWSSRSAPRSTQLGIEYLYLQFVSVTGRIVGKGIPADHWENVAERGFQLVYGSTANLFVDRHGEYIGYGPEASELVGIPDPETFVQLPWDKRVARMFCTLLPQPRGAGQSRRPSDLRLPRQPAPHPRRSSRRSTRACTCATAPSRR